MRKRVFPRIIWMILLNCVIFILLVMMQFTRRGNFSLRIGEMAVSGRYDLSVPAKEPPAGSAGIEGEEGPSGQKLAGEGLTVFFGGLEFRFDAFSGSGTGFCLVDSENGRQHVYPEYIAVMENGVIFTLPGAAELSFINGSPGGMRNGTHDTIPDLRISGKFPDGISAMEIPFRSQRSSVIRDSSSDTLTISYNGGRYQFSQPSQGIEAGRLVLSAIAPVVSYGILTEKTVPEFNPADFTVAQAEFSQTYSDALSHWVNLNFASWARSMASETDEDTVVAWCAEAVRQGTYRRAIAAIPVSFSSNPGRSWESAVYQFDRKIGVWNDQISAFSRFEREKTNRVSRLMAVKDSSLFTEPHLIEFLAIRAQDRRIEDLLAFAREMDPAVITLPLSAGILEAFSDMEQWRPDIDNPFEPFTGWICQLISGSLYRIGDQVFVFDGGRADTAFNLRLGQALNTWGEQSGNQAWAGLGRTLVLSVIALSGEGNSIPASLEIGENGELSSSDGRISTARLYRLMGSCEYLPHATATGNSGVWAWTAASSVTVTQNESMMNVAVRFPVGDTHYVMLRNVRPFVLLQIYGQDWRMAYDFESYYNSSGWYYLEREQTLILKVSHRANTENIRIYFTAPPRAAPVVQPTQQIPEQQADGTE